MVARWAFAVGRLVALPPHDPTHRIRSCPHADTSHAAVALDRTRVVIDPSVLDRFPGYAAAVVVASGVPNGPSDAHGDALLRAAEASLRARGLAKAADDPHIAAWRAAFSAFGAKPSRFPSSAEALAARVLKGGELPRVNRLVDVYNAVSVTHLVPVGGEDADRVAGTPRLVLADGSEPFDGPDGPPKPGEVVWRDDEAVTCRRWNWRQGRRTALTEQTSRALFILDALAPASPEPALAELAAHLETGWPGCTIERLL
jgi:DNA/RNA-binding domain of Phe-tRNA-synthetase-like protein